MNSNWSIFKVLEALMLIILVALLALPEIIEYTISHKLKAIDNCDAGKVSVSIPGTSILVSDLTFKDFPLGKQNLANGKIESLNVKGIHLFEILFSNNLEMDAVIFNSPELQVRGIKNTQFIKQTKSKSPFSEITFNKVKVVSGNLSGRDTLGGISTVSNLDLEFGSLKLEGDSIIMPDPDWKISSGNIYHFTADQMYRFSCYKMNGSSREHNLVIDSVKIDPAYAEIEFSKKAPYQTDRFDLSCERLLLTGFSIKDNHIENLEVTVPKLNVFRNKKIPRDPSLKFRSLQYYLKNFAFEFGIDTLSVMNGDVRYRELGEKSKEIGEVRFFKIAMEATRLSGRTSSTDTLKIVANSGFMDTGKLNATFSFPYNQSSFECRGELKHMSLSEMNRISEPAAGVVISSGTLYSMPFNFKATDAFSSGQLLINYRDLEFVLQDKPAGDSDNLFSKVKTMVASIFIKKDSKEKEGDKSLEGKICVERRSDRFIFNYMWKSILSGIKSALAGSITNTKPAQSEPC